METKRPILSLKPKINTAFLGIKPTNSRQSTRALHTDSIAWKRIRKGVLRRDLYRCAGWPNGEHAPGCSLVACEVDHRDGNSSNNADSNFQSLSKQCHS